MNDHLRGNNRKGNHAELLARKWLESQGYYVHRMVRTNHFGFTNTSNDIFGNDLVAKKVGERTRWIQVTAGSGIGRKIAEHDLVPWDSQHDSVEIWRWVGGQKRKNKQTGVILDRQYFQIYHREQGYKLIKENRVCL